MTTVIHIVLGHGHMQPVIDYLQSLYKYTVNTVIIVDVFPFLIAFYAFEQEKYFKRCVVYMRRQILRFHATLSFTRARLKLFAFSIVLLVRRKRRRNDEFFSIRI